ncbi:hypothetical protein BDV28DRAFT_128355, partial [Aspergillus coremiiformis]
MGIIRKKNKKKKSNFILAVWSIWSCRWSFFLQDRRMRPRLPFTLQPREQTLLSGRCLAVQSSQDSSSMSLTVILHAFAKSGCLLYLVYALKTDTAESLSGRQILES